MNAAEHARRIRSSEFRFYEELNDFLSPERRKVTFTHEFHGTPSVKDTRGSSDTARFSGGSKPKPRLLERSVSSGLEGSSDFTSGTRVAFVDERPSGISDSLWGELSRIRYANRPPRKTTPISRVRERSRRLIDGLASVLEGSDRIQWRAGSPRYGERSHG